ncbi:helix-turn-helix domain-containing protein [Streptomyces sp. NPDC003943]
MTVKRLTLRFREGETTVRRALNELVAAGYLERRRVALGGGRFATRVISYDRPGAAGSDATAPAPVREKPAPAPVKPPSTPPPPPASEVATAVLARLRTVDPRLLLSWRDVRELAPSVDKWLGQGVRPDQVTRTLTAALPPEHVPIHQPARFLAYRLDAMLPPPLPAEVPETPEPTPPARPPLVSCDGCERAIRTYDEKPMCADCRAAAA